MLNKNNVITQESSNSSDALLLGIVVAAFGKRFQVELSDVKYEKKRISCVTRGKKTDIACGDMVSIKLTDKREGVKF